METSAICCLSLVLTWAVQVLIAHVRTKHRQRMALVFVNDSTMVVTFCVLVSILFSANFVIYQHGFIIAFVSTLI